MHVARKAVEKGLVFTCVYRETSTKGELDESGSNRQTETIQN